MPSIRQDAAFKAFCTLISQNQQSHAWELVLCTQAYPDPKELLCDSHFCSIITQTEPGVRIDYEQMRNDSLLVGGTPDRRLRTAKLCNDLSSAHRNFVQARACVEGFTLYDKMIDRFYRKVADDEFLHFVANSSSTRAQMVWPSYEAIKELIRIKLDNWLRELQRYTSIIYEVKKSASTKHFLDQLDAVRRAKIVESTCTAENSTASSEATMTVAERKRAIERRNRITQRARQRANEHLRLQNKHNVHQTGEQGRHPNSDLVISNISRKLKEFKARQTEIQPGDLFCYKTQLKEHGVKPALLEVMLEEAKTALEEDARVDMSEHLVFAEGFSNVSNIVVENEE